MELVRLPSPPHILSKLLDVCHDPDSSIDDLADLIVTDAALTAKLIMAVNSKAFDINQPVTDLKHAISLVGHDLVKTMATTSSLQQLFAGLINTQKEFICNAWLDSLYCALFAKAIARALDYEHPQDAYLAGLFHDFGQIVFDAKFHEQYVSIMNTANEAETIHKETIQFGMSHTELGASVIEQWMTLNPSIADAARFHHEDEEQLKGCDMLCQIVAEASQLAYHWSQTGKPDPKWSSRLVNADELGRIYQHVQNRIAETSTTLGIPVPKSGSLTQPEFVKDIEKETIRLARKIRDASLINVISSEEPDGYDPDSPRSLLLKIAREMQLLFSISDVAMLLADRGDPGHLTLYEVSHIQPVSKFSIDNESSKIIKSYSERANFWIEPEDRDKMHEIYPISDRQVIRRLNHEIALSVPLGHGDRVVGAIVIGAAEAQKRNLDNLSKFIFGYLRNVADLWLKNSQVVNQQAFEDHMRKDQEQKDIDKLVHEISNPLSVIGNYIDIIKANSESSGAKNRKEIDILKEELQRIGNIVLNFKDSKVSDSQSVSLNDELLMCIPVYLKSISKGQDVQINWQLDEADADINIDRDSLRQIVLNLVKNSVEAKTGAGGITVSSHHFVNIDGRSYAQFTIADRGRGIDAITRQQLFSASTSTKRGANRGFGLTVVAELLRDINGQIKYMENEFGGASFEVLIPLLLDKQSDS